MALLCLHAICIASDSPAKKLTLRQTALDPCATAQVSTRLASTARSLVPIFPAQDAAEILRARNISTGTDSTLPERRRASNYVLQENRFESARATRQRLRATRDLAFGDHASGCFRARGGPDNRCLRPGANGRQRATRFRRPAA